MSLWSTNTWSIVYSTTKDRKPFASEYELVKVKAIFDINEKPFRSYNTSNFVTPLISFISVIASDTNLNIYPPQQILLNSACSRARILENCKTSYLFILFDSKAKSSNNSVNHTKKQNNNK